MRFDSQYQHLVSLAVGYAALLFCFSHIIVASISAWPLLTIEFGMVMAVIHLSAFWCVMGPAAYWQRSLYSFAIAAIPGIAVILGLQLGPASEVSYRDAVELAATVPILWAIAQLPNWVLRHFNGWHIVDKTLGRNAQSDTDRLRKTSILDMMVLTGTIAFGLGMLQFGQHFGHQNRPPNDYTWLISASLALLASYIAFCLPVVWVTFRANVNYENGCLGLLTYCFALGLFVFLVSALAMRRQLLDTFGFSLVAMGLIGSFLFAFSVPLVVSRHYGFHLVTNKQRKQKNA